MLFFIFKCSQFFKSFEFLSKSSMRGIKWPSVIFSWIRKRNIEGFSRDRKEVEGGLGYWPGFSLPLFTLIFQEMRLGTGRRLYDLFWRLQRSRDRHAMTPAQTQLFRRTVFLKIFLSVVAIGLNGRVRPEDHSRSS